MRRWKVRATWMEDESEVSETWELNAPTLVEAIGLVATHFNFPPHHIEATTHALQTGLTNREEELLARLPFRVVETD